MSEHDARSANRGSGLAVASVLGPALDEIRWRHPGLRASCGAFLGPAIHVLATSHPDGMSSLVGVRAVGAPATAFAELLQGTDEVMSSDVREHSLLRTASPAILGEDTRAVAIVPVPAGDEVIGFLHLDASQTGRIDIHAVERLHELAPMASLAILLEQERVRSQAHVSRVQQLHTSMCRHTVRERQAILELQHATSTLGGLLEVVAPNLGDTERLKLSAIVRKCTEHVDVAADILTDAGGEAVAEHRCVGLEPN
ncbi:MAG: hypothetical protein KUG77_26345 [Nannocystaceae bacterium]|nr:hypothetical protein [Nannocystaceae bacterium]